MVNTARRLTFLVSRTLPCVLGASALGLGSTVLAQSTGAFATIPYAQTTPQQASAPARPAQVPVNAPRYRGPAPVTMFRATPPPAPAPEPAIVFVEPPPEPRPMTMPVLSPAPVPITPPREVRPYSIANQAQIDASNAGWNPSSLDPVMAPPVASGAGGGGEANAEVSPRYLASQTSGQLRRSPVRRIVQDTRRAITRDLPEGVADALPWVDRDAKNEPFDEVLDRVAADLHRAAQADPAWALPAQREIRALSKRLDLLTEPPPLAQTEGQVRPDAIVAGLDDRPFRPRPIWPGASGRPEAQVRPVTLITSGTQQEGPRATGVSARYVPAAEDDDGNPPQTRPRGRQRSRSTTQRVAQPR